MVLRRRRLVALIFVILILAITTSIYFSKQNENELRLLTIFSTFRNTEERLKIQLNTAKNWAQFKPKVNPLLFNTFVNDTFSKQISETGWFEINGTRTNKFGAPILKDMFLKAFEFDEGKSHFYGFSTADILYDKGLIKTLEKVKTVFPDDLCLVIGRRSNFKADLKKLMFRFEEIKTIKADLFIPDALDFFFFSHLEKFPWQSFYTHDVVIRLRHDNWMVVQALRNNIIVIDATKTMKALHQSDSNGNFASQIYSDAYYNEELIGPYPFEKGTTNHAPYYSAIGPNSTVMIKKRF